MPIYHLTLDRSDWNRYTLEGAHEWTAPPLACGVCGARWKTTGDVYPAVDVEGIRDEYPVGVPALANAAFEALAHRVSPLLPAGATLRPGTEFGPFEGTAKGRFPDLAWAESWTCFFQLDACVRLQKAGISLPVLVPAKLTLPGKGVLPDLLEPQAVPAVDLARESLNEPDRLPCERCGRQPGGFSEFLVNRGTRMPRDVDLCRARNCPTLYLVSSRFAEAADRLGLRGCLVHALPEV
jgi:uncharacterized double-CXXCG motif protein